MTEIIPFDFQQSRYPVIRSGEREPIDPYKRRLIFIRDGYTCQWCGLHVEPDTPAPGKDLVLDHVIPWSAGGSDRSDNLRTLCYRCNEDRSNYVDLNPPRLIGVAADCYWCAERQGEIPSLLIGVPPSQLDRIPAFCGRCSATSWVPTEGWLM
jgi:hypothetical protein